MARLLNIMKKKKKTKNYHHLVVVCVMVVALILAVLAYVVVQHVMVTNLAQVRLPLQADEDGILLVTVNVSNKSIECCFDTASSHVLLSSDTCKGCNATPVETERFICNGTTTLRYGTQTDEVDLCVAPELRLMAVGKDVKVQNAPIAISRKRQGSSRYNILGVARGGSLLKALRIQTFIVSVGGEYVDLMPAKSRVRNFRLLDLLDVPSQQHFYAVSTSRVHLGDKVIHSGGGIPSVFDTGTNFLHLPEALYREIETPGETRDLKLEYEGVTLTFTRQTYFYMGQLLIQKSSDNCIIVGSLFLNNLLLYFSPTHLGISLV